jgi:hypothetical protein
MANGQATSATEQDGPRRRACTGDLRETKPDNSLGGSLGAGVPHGLEISLNFR